MEPVMAICTSANLACWDRAGPSHVAPGRRPRRARRATQWLGPTSGSRLSTSTGVPTCSRRPSMRPRWTAHTTSRLRGHFKERARGDVDACSSPSTAARDSKPMPASVDDEVRRRRRRTAAAPRRRREPTERAAGVGGVTSRVDRAFRRRASRGCPRAVGSCVAWRRRSDLGDVVRPRPAWRRPLLALARHDARRHQCLEVEPGGVRVSESPGDLRGGRRAAQVLEHGQDPAARGSEPLPSWARSGGGMLTTSIVPRVESPLATACRASPRRPRR